MKIEEERNQYLNVYISNDYQLSINLDYESSNRLEIWVLRLEE